MGYTEFVCTIYVKFHWDKIFLTNNFTECNFLQNVNDDNNNLFPQHFFSKVSELFQGRGE